jgi:hypothetical protein
MVLQDETCGNNISQSVGTAMYWKNAAALPAPEMMMMLTVS